MTKDQIKLICESDDNMQWWAMVLFAEISALISYNLSAGVKCDDCTMSVIISKVQEFPALVIQRAIAESGGKLSQMAELERRLESLERWRTDSTG